MATRKKEVDKTTKAASSMRTPRPRKSATLTSTRRSRAAEATSKTLSAPQPKKTFEKRLVDVLDEVHATQQQKPSHMPRVRQLLARVPGRRGAAGEIINVSIAGDRFTGVMVGLLGGSILFGAGLIVGWFMRSWQ